MSDKTHNIQVEVSNNKMIRRSNPFVQVYFEGNGVEEAHIATPNGRPYIILSRSPEVDSESLKMSDDRSETPEDEEFEIPGVRVVKTSGGVNVRIIDWDRIDRLHERLTNPDGCSISVKSLYRIVDETIGNDPWPEDKKQWLKTADLIVGRITGLEEYASMTRSMRSDEQNAELEELSRNQKIDGDPDYIKRPFDREDSAHKID